jgi:hypothetical protein
MSPAKRQVLCALIACLCVMLLAAGCSKPKALPAGWPIPQLTLPPQAELVQVISLPGSKSAPVAVASYTTIFIDPLPPEQVVADVEGKLKPLGYLRAPSRMVPAQTMHIYYSPDGKMQVLLDCQAAGQSGGRYSLDILVSTPPLLELTRDATPI